MKTYGDFMIKYLPDFMIGFMIGVPLAGMEFVLQMLLNYVGGLISNK